jgi:hypothetical protein
LPSTEHPPADLPTREGEARLPEDFGFGLAFTAPGMSGDYTRPVLLGIHLAATEDGHIDVQATDTYALCAYLTKPSDAAGLLPEGGIILPPQVFDAIRALGWDTGRGAWDLTLLKGTLAVEAAEFDEEANPIAKVVQVWGIASGEWEIWFRQIEGGWPNTAKVIEPAEQGNAFFFGARKPIADLCRCIAQVKRDGENIPRLLLSPRGIVGAWGLENNEDGPIWATENPLDFCGGPEVQEQWANARRLGALLDLPEGAGAGRTWEGAGQYTEQVCIAISAWTYEYIAWTGKKAGGYGMFTISFKGLPQARRILMPVQKVALPDWLDAGGDEDAE